MGLLEIGSRVLTTYQADTSQMKAALKGLQGEEKALAAAELEAAEARNDQMESWIGSLGKVSAGIAAFAGVAKLALDGYRDSISDARQMTALHGIDLEKLKEAAHGLVSENELLARAAKLANGAFRNSQEDLETAEKAMLSLTRQGRDQAEVTQKVTEALQTLRVRGLQELGIYVDTSKVKFDANGEVVDDYNNKLLLHKKILDALKNQASDVVAGEDQVGESFKRTTVTLQDSFDDLKKGLGQLVVAMQPLLQALAKAVDLIALAAGKGGAGTVVENYLTNNVDSYAQSTETTRLNPAALRALGLSRGTGGSFDFEDDVKKALLAKVIREQTLLLKGLKGASAIDEVKFYDTFDSIDKWLKDNDPNKPLTEDQKYALAVDLKNAVNARFSSAIAAANAQGNISSRGIGSLGAKADFVSEGDLTGHDMEDSAMAGIRQRGDDYNAMMSGATAAYKKFQSGKRDSQLEKIFGPVGEFEIYKKAFDSLSGAVGSAYDAWASGSESAAAAFKKFIAQSVEAVGKQMAIEAIKEGAYALGHLAIGDFGGAAAHGLAAAEFAAGAVIAGVVAKEMGAGGSTTPSGSTGGKGATTGGSPGSGSSAPQQQQAIIVVGETFDQSTPRQRQLKARQLVQRATGNAGFTNS